MEKSNAGGTFPLVLSVPPALLAFVPSAAIIWPDCSLSVGLMDGGYIEEKTKMLNTRI